MSIRKTFFFLAAAAAGYALVKSKGQGQTAPAQDAAPAVASPVVSVVEETLHQHEGEDTPFVHAFEEALHQEPGHAPASAS